MSFSSAFRLELLPSPSPEMARLGLRHLERSGWFFVHLTAWAAATLFLLVIDLLTSDLQITWSALPVSILAALPIAHGFLVFVVSGKRYRATHQRLEQALLRSEDNRQATDDAELEETRNRLFSTVEEAREALRTISPEIAADVARGESHALTIVSWLDEAQALRERTGDHHELRQAVAAALSRPSSQSTRPHLQRLRIELEARDAKLAALEREVKRRHSLLESFFLALDSTNMAKVTDGVLALVSGSIRERVDLLEAAAAAPGAEREDALVQDREARRIRQEVSLAQDLQRSLLPGGAPDIDGLSVAYLYQPSSEVGGDFFDFYEIGPGRLLIALGDASGHGLDSSMVSSMAKSALYTQVSNQRSLEESMSEMNRMMCDTLGSRRLMTFLLVELDTEAQRLSWVNAGQVFPFLRRGDQLQELEQPSYPLGVRSDIHYQRAEHRLEPGDLLLLLTDGCVEAVDARGRGYGWDRLGEQLLALEQQSTEQMVTALAKDLESHLSGTPPQDDVTLVAVRFDP